MSPALRSECPECKHCLINVNHFSVWLLHLIQHWAHSMEQWAVVGIRKVNVSLSSLDVLEPDLVLQVYTTDSGWGDLDFTKLSMKHVSAFNQWQMRGFIKSCLRDKVPNVMLWELMPARLIDLKHISRSVNRSLDKLDNSCDRELNHLRNRLIV